MSTKMFWARVALYNQAFWPIQVIFAIGAAFFAYRVVAKPGRRTDVWMKGFLALAFAWDGIIALLIYLRSPISTFIGAPLFILVAVLFAIDIRAQRTAFRLPSNCWKQLATYAWLALVALYPLVGWVFLGHAYPRMLLPGMPCPLTVFAITLVAGSAPRADRKVFIALLPWALMGLPKCFGALDCYEDCILFGSGLYGLIVLIRNRRSQASGATQSTPLLV